jgi:hypothetical protein
MAPLSLEEQHHLRIVLEDVQQILPRIEVGDYGIRIRPMASPPPPPVESTGACLAGFDLYDVERALGLILFAVRRGLPVPGPVV